MSTVNDGGPAYPVPGMHSDPDYHGMSLRDRFALSAMQALIGTRHADYQGDDGPEIVSEDAYTVADAMLRARSGTGGEG